LSPSAFTVPRTVEIAGFFSSWLDAGDFACASTGTPMDATESANAKTNSFFILQLLKFSLEMDSTPSWIMLRKGKQIHRRLHLFSLH
jgi:hypothetical protein